ncbi:MAG: hypothetical protein IK066_00465 [Kiritimatiellae bacterium]|nr:hypothetical protein [Kiritimatiellia bacterium]
MAMDERGEGQMDLFGEGEGLEMRLEDGAKAEGPGGPGLRMVLPGGSAAEGDADAAGEVREVFAEGGQQMLGLYVKTRPFFDKYASYGFHESFPV